MAPHFDAPYLSTSLADFWSRRWVRRRPGGHSVARMCGTGQSVATQPPRQSAAHLPGKERMPAAHLCRRPLAGPRRRQRAAHGGLRAYHGGCGGGECPRMSRVGGTAGAGITAPPSLPDRLHAHTTGLPSLQPPLSSTAGPFRACQGGNGGGATAPAPGGHLGLLPGQRAHARAAVCVSPLGGRTPGEEEGCRRRA